MNAHRLRVAPVLGSLLAVVTGGLAWGSALSQASGDDPVAAALASPEAQSAGTTTTLEIQVSGTVNAQPESVLLSGNAQITATAVWDRDLDNPPVVILDINVLGLTGTGQVSGNEYLSNVAIHKVRPLAAADTLEVAVPIVPATAADVPAEGSGLATFALTFDPNSGVLTGATGTIGDPPGSRPQGQRGGSGAHQ